MDVKHSLNQLSPAHSYSSRGSSRGTTQGYLYDDYAREIPRMFRSGETDNCCPEKTEASQKQRMKSPLFVVACLAAVVFLVQLGASLADVPSTRLLENSICQKHYHGTSSQLMPEIQCAVGPVQGELNVISTGALVLGYLTGILVAIPYGSLADRHGRKAVLRLSIIGMVISQLIWIAMAWNWRRWDLKLVWTSSAGLLVGGGESVAEAMVFAMIADIAPQEKRAVYFQVEICAVLLAEAIAPFIASAMMIHSVWLPILISPAIMAVGGLLTTMIPETLHMSLAQEKQKTGQPNTPTFSKRARRYAQTMNFDPSTRWSRIRDSAHATLRLLKTRDLKLLLPTASLTIPVATITMSLVLRYITLRFGWTLTQTGMILGVRTGFNILVLLVFIPALGWLVSKGGGDRDRDVTLARVSVVLLVVGQTVFAAAPTVVAALVGLGILTLGTGAPSLCRAALARTVDSDSTGRVFGVVAVCEMVGYLVGGVGFGALYQVGLKMGLGPDGTLRAGGDDWWLALVFYVAAVVYFWCGGMLWVVNPKAAAGRLDGDMGSVRSGSSGGSEKSAHEMRVLADGRVTRKYPSLESVLGST